MSSLARRMQRKVLRSRPDYEPKPQPTVVLKDRGYRTLTPTKGWRVFSGARLAAQGRMAYLLNPKAGQAWPTDLLTGLIRSSKKPSKVWRKPAPAAPSTETRQQRRAKARQA